MNYSRLLIRTECKPGERRTPLTPGDAGRLRAGTGVPVQVERSAERGFPDADYARAGCALVPPGTWMTAGSDTLVLGLKELPADPAVIGADHAFFSHAYRGQTGGAALLRRFDPRRRNLFDLEYLVDEDGRRRVAFGFWAGYVGAALGLLDYHGALPRPLRAYPRRSDLRAAIRAAQAASAQPSVAACVTGAAGRAGQGALALLREFGVEPLAIDLANRHELARLGGHALVVHCVGGACAGEAPFLSAADLGAGLPLRHLVDVTCDYTSAHHRFPFYDSGTTLEEPAREIGGVRLIAIDHLPTLLPVESSEEFSAQLTPLLGELLGAASLDAAPVWKRALPEANA